MEWERGQGRSPGHTTRAHLAGTDAARDAGGNSRTGLHKAFAPMPLAGGFPCPPQPACHQLCPTYCPQQGRAIRPECRHRCQQWPCSLRALFPGGSIAPGIRGHPLLTLTQGWHVQLTEEGGWICSCSGMGGEASVIFLQANELGSRLWVEGSESRVTHLSPFPSADPVFRWESPVLVFLPLSCLFLSLLLLLCFASLSPGTPRTCAKPVMQRLKTKMLSLTSCDVIQRVTYLLSASASASVKESGV